MVKGGISVTISIYPIELAMHLISSSGIVFVEMRAKITLVDKSTSILEWCIQNLVQRLASHFTY